MMSTCPRCNFTQPKDRFCANCGIDMESYKPKPKPLMTTIWNSGWTQVIIFAFLFSLTGYYLTSKYKEKKFLRAIVETFTEIEPEEEMMLEVEEQDEELVDTDEPNIIAKKTGSKDELKDINFKESELPPPPKNVIISFAEAKISYLSSLNDSNTQGQMLKATSINLKDDIGPFISRHAGLASLPGATNGTLKVNSSVNVNKTFTFNEEEYGLEVFVTPIEVEEDDSSADAQSPYKVTLKIQISFSLPPGPETTEPQQVVLEEEITVNPDDELILSEIFPRIGSIPNGLKPLVSSTPMSAFFTNEYKNQETDLVIFIQLK